MERDLLEDMIRHFADPRYLRVDDRPLFLIYRPALVPEPRATFERWRSAIETATGERVLLLMAQSFEDWDPRPYGLDGAVEFPPHKLAIDLPERAGEVEPFSPDFAGSVRNYDDLIAEAARVAVPDFPLVRTVVPSWDNEARRPGRGLTFAGSSPASYQHWLSSSIGWARKHPLETEPLVFVNAWNEWAEGAYLEPDVYFGAAYLNATRRAVVSLPRSGEHRRIVLVGHDAARHGAQQLLLALGKTFSRQFGFEVEFLLLAGGDLLSSYQEVGEVHVFEASDPRADDLIVSLLNRGFDQAIANTTVSGPMVARLDGAGFRVVSLIHEMGAFIADRGWTDAARAVASSAARIVFPAEFVRERFSTIAPVSIDKSVIAHQGLYRDSMVQGDKESQRISVRTELGITSASHIVLGVGFADLRKGVDLFVQTAVIASRIAPNLHFVWVGGGDRHVRHWLIDAAPTGAHSNVTIIEHTENIDRYYSAADVLFVSSREDAFPSTVMEAMSVGLPVVGFAGCTGTESLIERAGRVVDAFDLEAVVAGISGLIQGETPEGVEARRQIIADEFRFDDYAFCLEKELEPDTAGITVIVPTFNYAALLGQRMAGIFSQTHPVFEVIVLDDASTDNTVDTLAEIGRDSRRDFRVVQRETNSGSVWRQWLDGVRMARSEYVWIAEADDDAEPGLLKALIAPFVGADTAPAFAFCDSAQIDGEGRRLGDSYRPYLDEHAGDRFHTDFRMKGSDFLRRHMTVRNLILNASSVLFRRDLLLQVLEEHMDDLVQLRFAGDWIVYSRLCELGDVAFISNPLNIHRRHAGLTLGSNPSDHIAEIELVHGMLTRRLDLPARVQAEQKEYREELLKTLGSGG
jgi:glycosyltransferase involved in cell wall biosynthesis